MDILWIVIALMGSSPRPSRLLLLNVKAWKKGKSDELPRLTNDAPFVVLSSIHVFSIIPYVPIVHVHRYSLAANTFVLNSIKPSHEYDFFSRQKLRIISFSSS